MKVIVQINVQVINTQLFLKINAIVVIHHVKLVLDHHIKIV